MKLITSISSLPLGEIFQTFQYIVLGTCLVACLVSCRYDTCSPNFRLFFSLPRHNRQSLLSSNLGHKQNNIVAIAQSCSIGSGKPRLILNRQRILRKPARPSKDKTFTTWYNQCTNKTSPKTKLEVPQASSSIFLAT